MSPRTGKIVAIVVGIIIILAGSLAGGLLAYHKYYQGKIYPGVSVANYELGGLTPEAAKNLLEGYNDRLAREGLDFTATTVEGKSFSFKVNNLIGSDSGVELAKLDSDVVVAEAMQAGRSTNLLAALFSPVALRWFRPVHLVPSVVVDEVGLRDSLKPILAPYENGGQNAKVVVTDITLATYEVAPEQAGGVFDGSAITTALRDKVAGLSFLPVTIKQSIFRPTVLVADAEQAGSNLSTILAYGDIGLNYINPQTKIRTDWIIHPADFVGWLELARDMDGKVIFIFNEAATKKYLDNLRSVVDQSAENAKFTVGVDGKVTEFQASQSGLSINLDKTYSVLKEAFKERNYHPAEAIKTVGLVVDTVDPQVQTADVNSLGISAVLGVGVSTFYDSHSNRIKNIINAIKKLNGTLIRPGEVFSANKYAGPYTVENGFLSEAVIKGRAITYEIGGGMCQIGTTLFRMAMNSGMDIVQRQNHSLVVSYYADPVNKNPGTDAALYEPTVDLKFTNDTGYYLLLQTDIDLDKQIITFTLWGHPDGRSGSYDHPVVSKWIPSGAEETIIVGPDNTDSKLKVGETKCQTAFRGAVASFTYSRVTPTGEKIDRVFDSYYRALPKICTTRVDALPAASTSTPI
ncbi:MAG: VanW family protein [bacterium]|nr:VanW family protein [bacterium]